MVVFQGYCRPLKQKVEFQVESVNRLETKRGIKWSVKGHYEGNKISTFTNEENAQRLLEQLDNTVVEEPMEVFGAEIAYQEAEDDDVNAKVYFFHKGEEINFEVKNSKDINKIVKDIKSKVDFYPNTFDIEVIEGENLNYHTYIKQPSNTNKVNYILKKEEPILKRGKRGAKGMKMGLLAEDMRSGLTAKHYKKDGSLDLRYKICREIAAAEKKNAEENQSQTKKEDKDIDDEVEEILTEAAVDEVLESDTWQGKSLAGSLDEMEEMLGRKKEAEESFDAETYQKVYRAEPNAIIFEEHIPPEIWNIMGPDAQGHYLATRDESVLIAPCCGVTKAEMRIDNDANIECGSCVFSGDDFHPRWWADKPVPKVRKVMDAEELPMEDLYGNTATVPADVYYRFMLQLPPTVSATPTDDGFSMILGFHNQNAEFVENLIEAYSPYEDAGDSQDTLYAEDISFVPKNPTGAVLTLNKFAEELENYEAEMSCPPATQDVAINTKNRNATIKNFGYGPLNVDEPGDFWEDIAKQWKTTVKAAKKSKCGNCVAFDRSPRMKTCMPGETSDGEGVLGYCWMHHFKCHSARTCDTWAKGGPITTDKVSEGWQERAFAKPKASKTATEAGKATAKASESFDVEFEEWGKQEMLTHGKDVSFKDWLEEEADSHGDMPLVEWAKDEEKSHDERYEAEDTNLLNTYFEEEVYRLSPDIYAQVKDRINYNSKQLGNNPSHQDRLKQFQSRVRRIDENIYQRAMETAQMRIAKEEEDFEAQGLSFANQCYACGGKYKVKNMKHKVKLICYDCGEFTILPKSHLSESNKRNLIMIEEGFKENEQNEDFHRKFPQGISTNAISKFDAESDKPVNKTLFGALGVGVLGAIFAPKYVKSLFDKINKR